MSGPPSRRRLWPKLLILIGFLGIVALGLGLTLHPWLVDHFAGRALQKLEARLGLRLSAQLTTPEGLYGAHVHELRVGGADQLLATVRHAHVQLDRDSVWARDPWPTEVALERAVLHVRSDGTLEGAARALMAALPDALKERLRGQSIQAAADGRDGRTRALPRLTIRDGRIIDEGGALDLREAELSFAGHEIEGSAWVYEPPLGHCTVRAGRMDVELRCSQALELKLPKGFVLRGRALHLFLQPTLQLRLEDVRVHSSPTADPRLAQLLGGVTVSVTVDLDRQADGRWPIAARLNFPGGGGVQAKGTADRQSARLVATMDQLDLEKLHPSVRGLLSGQVEIEGDRVAGEGFVQGRLRFEQVLIDHKALTQEPIGPFDLEGQGRIDVQTAREGGQRRFWVRLHAHPDQPQPEPLTAKQQKAAQRKKPVPLRTGARLRLGTIEMLSEASVDTRGEAPKISVRFSVPPGDAQKVAEALPKGLLPNLEPLAATGRFGFDGQLELNFADLKATVLEASLLMERLKITQINPAVNLEALSESFTTRFEMPDGETVYERLTGPESERWVPLEDIPPLFPQAVVAQEDGGFYRHGGVSLFHLRGSLVRNLERGHFVRGGSTITMQLARNLFLNRKKTLGRKLEELIVTWLLEQHLTKDELITLYLNVVEFGEGIFGVKDAAQHYFEKAPREMDPVEVAFLTRLLPAPRRWGGQKEKGKVEGWYAKRIERLLALLVSRGHLSPEHLEAARPDQLFRGPTMDPPWQVPQKVEEGAELFELLLPPEPTPGYGLEDPFGFDEDAP